MAMTGKIVVSTAEMVEKANQAESSLSNMRSGFDTLRNLMDGTKYFWNGKASDAHRESYQQKLARIDQIFQFYREHIADLREMAGVYDDSSAKIERAIDSLTQPDFD